VELFLANITYNRCEWSVHTVNSASSSTCSRYDPVVLRHELAAMKQHVEQLRREVDHMETEMQYTQQGHRALSLYDSFTHCLHQNLHQTIGIPHKKLVVSSTRPSCHIQSLKTIAAALKLTIYCDKHNYIYQ